MRYLWILILGTITISGCSIYPSKFQGSKHASEKHISSLIGKDRTFVEKKFGMPQLIRQENKNALWSYQSNACALLVYFNHEGVCQHAETRGICQ